MTKPDPDKVINDLLKRALLREAKGRLQTGVRWPNWARIGRETIETLLLWVLGALVGLGLMFLTVLIL